MCLLRFAIRGSELPSRETQASSAISRSFIKYWYFEVCCFHRNKRPFVSGASKPLLLFKRALHGHDPTRRSGQEISQISRFRSSSVRPGPVQLGRVESGRVESGRVRRCSSSLGSGRVTHTRPDSAFPTRFDPTREQPCSFGLIVLF